ncbi:MAG TPA: hypothetical protein PLS99_07680, partial [Thermotogota bacterium]|nr:hypothetical protein [Thermotogota bacterium]
VKKGGAGRFGTWAFSYGYTTTAGLGELAIRVLKGEASLTRLPDLMAAYNKFTPGAAWNGSFYVDANTGIRARNHILIYQDTYVFGQGFLGSANQEVPEKYLDIR